MSTFSNHFDIAMIDPKIPPDPKKGSKAQVPPRDLSGTHRDITWTARAPQGTQNTSVKRSGIDMETAKGAAICGCWVSFGMFRFPTNNSLWDDFVCIAQLIYSFSSVLSVVVIHRLRRTDTWAHDNHSVAILRHLLAALRVCCNCGRVHACF